jgi:hypothetical protein
MGPGFGICANDAAEVTTMRFRWPGWGTSSGVLPVPSGIRASGVGGGAAGTPRRGHQSGHGSGRVAFSVQHKQNREPPIASDVGGISCFQKVSDAPPCIIVCLAWLHHVCCVIMCAAPESEGVERNIKNNQKMRQPYFQIFQISKSTNKQTTQLPE